MNKVWLFLTSSVLTICVDQLSKWCVQNWIKPQEIIELLPLVNFTHIYNRGIAFGIASDNGASWKGSLILIFSICAMIAILILEWAWKGKSSLIDIALGIIFGGSIGNLIDRVRKGAVLDFIDVHWKRLHWPTFNVADMAVTIGAFLILWHILRDKEEEKKIRS